MTRCDIENISAYLDGEMPENDAAQLRAHLAECSSCAALYRDLSVMQKGFSDLNVPTPDTLAPGIMYKVNLGGDPPRIRRVIRQLIAVAACLIVVLVASKVVSPNELPDAPEEREAYLAAGQPESAGIEIFGNFDGEFELAGQGDPSPFGSRILDIDEARASLDDAVSYNGTTDRGAEAEAGGGTDSSRTDDIPSPFPPIVDEWLNGGESASEGLESTGFGEASYDDEDCDCGECEDCEEKEEERGRTERQPPPPR